MNKKLLLAGFEPGISGNGSNRAVIIAAQPLPKFKDNKYLTQ